MARLSDRISGRASSSYSALYPARQRADKKRRRYNDLSLRITDALYVKYDGFEYERLSAEQEKLLTFRPLITHSVSETTAHFAFHVQMIADFNTIEEIGYKMLEELDRHKRQP